MPTIKSGGLRVAALALLWGSSFLWIKISLEGFTPIQISLIRLVLGASSLILILFFLKLRLPQGRRVWGHLSVAAVFGNVIPYTLFALGEQEIPSSIAGVINATTPLWTALLTLLAYGKTKETSQNRWSLLLGFLGAILIFSPWNQGTSLWSIGALYCLGAAISYAISYIYIARYLAKEKSSVIPMATGQLICSALIILPLAAFSSWQDSIPWQATTSVIILGIFCTGLAYILNYRIITDDGPTAAAIMVYLLPVVSVILGVLVLQEHVPLQVLSGLILVLIAMWFRRPATLPKV